MRSRHGKWGEAIDSTEAHIAYLEQVRARFPERPDFRGEELRGAIVIRDTLKREMKARGKRRSDCYYSESVFPAISE